MLFKTCKGNIEISIPADSLVTEVYDKIQSHPSSKGRKVSHIIFKNDILDPMRSFHSYNVNSSDSLVVCFEPKITRISSVERNDVTMANIKEAIVSARKELGHPFVDNSDESEQPPSLPSTTSNTELELSLPAIELFRLLRSQEGIGSQSSSQRPSSISSLFESFLNTRARSRLRDHEANHAGGAGRGSDSQDVEATAESENDSEMNSWSEARITQELEKVMPMKEELLQQLVREFGFKENRARKALWMRGMDVNRAVDWLVGEPEEVQEHPITASELRAILQRERLHRAVMGLTNRLESSDGDGDPRMLAREFVSRLLSMESSGDDNHGANNEEMHSRLRRTVSGSTDDALAFSRSMPPTDDEPAGGSNFPPPERASLRRTVLRNQPAAVEPDPALVSLLVDMGFSEEDSKLALQYTRNDVEGASAVLLEEGDMLSQLRSSRPGST